MFGCVRVVGNDALLKTKASKLI
ncbi:MAG: hypothetical protein LVT47_15185 [Cyanobacteria bacterium LVE1205-1]